MSSKSGKCQDVEQLNIVDREGRTRIVLTTSHEGGMPFVNLNDENGVPRLALSLDLDGSPFVSFFTSTSFLAGSVGIQEKEGRTGITLWSPNGKYNLCIGVSNDGTIESTSYGGCVEDDSGNGDDVE